MKILITGGSLGIGLATAKEFHASGHELLLVARNPDTLQVAKDTLGSRTETFAADLADSVQISGLLQYIEQSNFFPNVLVLNAAAFCKNSRSVVTPSADELRDLLEVNVIANYQLVQGLLNYLKQSVYSRVVIIGSTASIRPDNGSLYGISKWALRSYAYSLRSELRTLGIGVTLINPGGTFTERRVPSKTVASDRLLEASDIGKLINTLLTLSPQAVVEEINIRPMLGDTY